MTEPRWRIALLLSVAIAISYLDRQALSVAVAAIQRDIPLTNMQFSHLQVGVSPGLRADVRRRRRARRRARHAARAARDHDRLVAGRGQPRAGDRLPLAARQPVPARHGRRRRLSGGDQGRRRSGFPRSERSTAMGIINAGTAVGAVVAPPAIAAILGVASWRWVFVATGAVGLRLDDLVGARLPARRDVRRRPPSAGSERRAMPLGAAARRSARSGAWSSRSS